MPIPRHIQDEKYIFLSTFRKSGVPVGTPVWFAEADGKLYLFTNPKSGKVKRIRNDPHVRIAPCTFRGKVTGPDIEATARILDSWATDHFRSIMKKKYWLMRVPFLWSKDSIIIELEVG